MGIRIATLSDLYSISEIEKLCFATDQFTIRQFRYLITKAKSSFVVMDFFRCIAGYSVLLTPSNPKFARIYSIAVHPKAKGKGVGRTLVQHHITIARRSGFQQVSLEVRDDNHAAIQLYESLGFLQVAQKKDYYEDGMQARVYRIKF